MTSFMTHRQTHLLGLLLLLAASPLVLSAPQNPAPQRQVLQDQESNKPSQKQASVFPATPAGKRAAAYIQVSNSGDETAMQKYFLANMDPGALQRRPVELRMKVFREIRQQLRQLTVCRLLEEDPEGLAVLAQAANGDWLNIRFNFTPPPSVMLLGLTLEGAAPPVPGEIDQGPLPPLRKAELLAALDKELQQRVSRDAYSGTVLVAKDGQPIFFQAYGLASKEFQVPNQLNTRYNLGSINKIFTKVAIAQLLQQGKLALDDTLGKHLPQYPNEAARSKVTIRHLLEMNSGIGDFFGAKFEATPKGRVRSIQDYLPLFAAEPLAFSPGTQNQYSNGGYVVLGAIIEAVSGQSYYDYVRTHIFQTAGMTSTDSFEADIPVPNLAAGYTRKAGEPGETSWRNNIYTRPARGSSAGGGYSTAEDLLRFATALQNCKLLSPAYSAWIMGRSFPGSQGDVAPPTAPLRDGGLGVAGGAPGINAALDIDLRRGLVVVVLGNYDPPAAVEASQAIRRLLRRWQE